MINLLSKHSLETPETAETTPNFFIVGAPKCGTTSIYYYLREHPEIFMSVPKEPMYFGRDLESHSLRTANWSEYQSYFREHNGEPVVGEATVWYLYSRRAAEEIHAHNPNSKIIMMLRDPVEAIYSLYRYMRYTGNEPKASFREALEAESRRKQNPGKPPEAYFPEGLYYREIYRYSEQIQRYQKWFDPEQIHVVILDSLKRDMEPTFRKILRFLDVDPEYRPDYRRYNSSCQIRFPLVRTMIRSVSGEVIRACRNAVSKKFCSSLWETLKPLVVEESKRSGPCPEIRRSLQKEFQPEIERLQTFFDLDLDPWVSPLNQNQ